jgi:hypothetical protein
VPLEGKLRYWHSVLWRSLQNGLDDAGGEIPIIYHDRMTLPPSVLHPESHRHPDEFYLGAGGDLDHFSNVCWKTLNGFTSR